MFQSKKRSRRSRSALLRVISLSLPQYLSKRLENLSECVFWVDLQSFAVVFASTRLNPQISTLRPLLHSFTHQFDTRMLQKYYLECPSSIGHSILVSNRRWLIDLSAAARPFRPSLPQFGFNRLDTSRKTRRIPLLYTSTCIPLQYFKFASIRVFLALVPHLPTDSLVMLGIPRVHKSFYRAGWTIYLHLPSGDRNAENEQGYSTPSATELPNLTLCTSNLHPWSRRCHLRVMVISFSLHVNTSTRTYLSVCLSSSLLLALIGQIFAP